MGVPSIDEHNTATYCLSPKFYQPATQDMDTMIEYPRKKKMFSSSSFYEEPNAIYPTVEEQVELCRKIADSLSDECNLKSKGANMFFKRVKRAEKWIVAESKENQHQNDSTDSITDPSKLPYVRPTSKGLPKLKLILDPRHLVDMKRLLKEGVDIVEHSAVSPEICLNIVKDLNSPTGKGAQLFAKRKKKSAEWIVDEEKVRALLRNRQQDGYSSPEPPVEPLMHPRVKSLSTDWPNINLSSQDVADTVIKAAEAKVMTYSVVPQVPIIEPLLKSEKPSQTTKKVSFAPPPSATPNPKSSQLADAYKYRVPKGWTSSATTDSLISLGESSVLHEPYSSARSSVISPISRSLSGSDLPRTFSFTNFNSSPKAWNSGITNRFQQPNHIKPVKPPSVLVQ